MSTASDSYRCLLLGDAKRTSSAMRRGFGERPGCLGARADEGRRDDPSLAARVRALLARLVGA